MAASRRASGPLAKMGRLFTSSRGVATGAALLMLMLILLNFAYLHFTFIESSYGAITRGEPASTKLDFRRIDRSYFLSSATPNSAFCGSNSSHCLPTFQDAVRRFDWRLREPYANSRWQHQLPSFWRKLLSLVWPLSEKQLLEYRQDLQGLISLCAVYVALDPDAPVDVSCGPPPEFFPPPASDLPAYCSKAAETHFGFFTGEPRLKPPKIFDTVILGFDVDILEARMWELNATVDYFVVVEARRQSLGLRKPLMFEQTRHRFQPFENKILYFTIPPKLETEWGHVCNYMLDTFHDACWGFEFAMRDITPLLLHKLSVDGEWGHNEAVMREFHMREGPDAQLLSDDDILIFSDPDEVPMGDRLLQFKLCEPEAQEQYGWLLVQFAGRVDMFVVQDSRIRPFPRTIGPLVDMLPWVSFANKTATLHGAERVRHKHTFERHRRSPLGLYMFGGYHMSDHAYLPFLMLKIPADEFKAGYEPWSVYEELSLGNIAAAQTNVWKKTRNWRQVGSRRRLRGDLGIEGYAAVGWGGMPWVMRCNPARFPSWFGMMDSRYTARPNVSFFDGNTPVWAENEASWEAILENLIRTGLRRPR